MDSANILDICTCGICLETFDESSKCPRILSCCHSFCHSCLGKLLAQNLCCPTCKAEILFQSTETIPINFSLKNLINIRSQILMPNTSTNLEGISEEAYKEQKQIVSQKVKEELGQRKTRTNMLTKSLSEMEEERKSLIEEIKSKELELKDRVKRIQELESLKAEEIKFCDQLKQLQTMVDNSVNYVEFSRTLKELERMLQEVKMQIPVELPPRHLPQTRESLGRLCRNRSVYAVEDRYDGTKYGKVALKDGRIFVASCQQEKPEDAALLSLPELLSRFNNGSSELPKTVFLRVTPDGGRDDSFEVIIETDGLTPRAKNFILLCSALKGPSFKGEKIYKALPVYLSRRGFHAGRNTVGIVISTQHTLGGRYESCPYGYFTYGYYIPSAPSPVVKVIRDDDPKTPWKEGDVYGMWEGNSQFGILLKDQPSYSYPKFGVIVAGLQRLKDLQRRSCSIEECGLVI